MAEQRTPGSLIITFYGAYGRTLLPGGRVPVASLIRLMGAVGVDPPAVRSAVSRLKRRGLLHPERSRGKGGAGYALSPAARQLLEDGDQRIYRQPQPDGQWLLAVFSVPESERGQRHLLRSRLTKLGFGNVAPGVWVAPSHLEEETRHTLRRLELDAYVDLFLGTHSGFSATEQAVSTWWDLDTIAALHQEFLQTQEPVLRAWSGQLPPLPSPGRPADEIEPREEAYRDYLLALDSWRQLRYADPGLPATVLPSDWPGTRSGEVFTALHELLYEEGAAFAAAHRGPG